MAEAFQENGYSTGWLGRLGRAFPAFFEERNYRLYFTGQFISLVGSWLQTVAQGWLVFELTRSAFWVGMVAALNSLPILAFVVLGGVIVDRFSRKKILYLTQIAPLLLAAALGALTFSGAATLFNVGVLAFLLGVVQALDMPARQAFVPEMVAKRHLASAIALNSVIFNGSRVIGPSAAGALINWIGLGGTFFVNAASFLAVMASLAFIRVTPRAHETHLHPIAALGEGFRYAFGRPSLRLFMALAAVGSMFGWSYVSILPVVAANVFGGGAALLGHFYTAAGLGALLGAALISLYVKRLGPRPFIIVGSIVLGVSLFTFSFVANIALGFVLLFFAGLGLLGQFSVINSAIQHSIDDRMRGRVMSIYGLFWRGTAPLGSFLMGTLGEAFGPGWAIRIGAILLLACAACVVFLRRRIPETLAPQET